MNLAHALRIQRHDQVALVGAGGKSSALFRLGDELADRGWQVVTTTSTHIEAGQIAWAPQALVRPDWDLEAVAALSKADLPHAHTLLIGPTDPQTGRARGLSPEIVDALLLALGLDAVINEADGARTLPFKAPAAHEPAIPPGTTLVVPVVGIDAVGQPLDAAHVHRPQQIAALTGAAPGQPVTPELVAAVLAHPQGGLKGVPPMARVVVLVNKVQRSAEIKAAKALAARLLEKPRIRAVAIGALRDPDPVRWVHSRVATRVLAAGQARRFGQLTQLDPWGDGTLLTHAVDTALASRARPVIVVLGCQAEACRAALGERPVQIVVNPDWAQGQSTSVCAGLAALPENVDGALFHLADLPGVTPAVLDALIARHAATLAPVVWPTCDGRRGNPVLFDRVTFPELQHVTGDVGGRPVLQAYARAGAAQRVPVDTPGILRDVDTPQDLP